MGIGNVTVDEVGSAHQPKTTISKLTTSYQPTGSIKALTDMDHSTFHPHQGIRLLTVDCRTPGGLYLAPGTHQSKK